MSPSARLWAGTILAALLVLAVLPTDASAQAGRLSYTVIVVREGQTLWSISRAYGVSVDTIVELNGLSSPDVISPGQRLMIPRRESLRIQATPRPAKTTARPTRITTRTAKTTTRPAQTTSYTYVAVREGQTLWSISRAYGVSVDTIVEVNGLRSPDILSLGQRLKIPVRGNARVRQAARPSARVPSIINRLQFVWPARGHLTSLFGWRRRARRHHDGIDIGASRGAPIVAALDGVVLYAGWFHAYGRMVIINHGNGLTTLYGHASKLLVRAGQRVSAGQLIAKVGCTGRCTGPHLHFEIRVNGRALNPLSASLVDSLPAPAPKAAAATKPATPAATPKTAAAVETVRRHTIVAEGSNGPIVQTIEETVREGKVVRRVEVTTSVENGEVIRVSKIYEIANGSLELKNETREVVQALEPVP